MANVGTYSMEHGILKATKFNSRKTTLGISWNIEDVFKNNSKFRHHKPRPSRRTGHLGHPSGELECQWPAEWLRNWGYSRQVRPKMAQGFLCPFAMMFGQQSHKTFATFKQNGIRSQMGINGRPDKLQEGQSMHQRQIKNLFLERLMRNATSQS